MFAIRRNIFVNWDKYPLIVGWINQLTACNQAQYHRQIVCVTIFVCGGGFGGCVVAQGQLVSPGCTRLH